MPSAAAGSWLDPTGTGTDQLGSIIGSKRGLPTSIKSYSDISNGYYIETHGFYDQYGNATIARDGRNNDTTTGYDAAYAFAYPSTVTTAVPDPTGVNGSNTPLSTSSTYDYNTGLPLTTTDINGQTTTMEYVDPLLRLSKTTAPNGQQTITEYGAPDSNGQLPSGQRFVKIRSQIDETNWKQGYTWADGLGRAIKTQSVETAGDVFAETQYDIMGRVQRVSNPYHSGDIVYWTESTYDDLGRVTKVKTLGDNAEVNTAYSLATSGSQIGTVVTVTDQAGKQRRSIMNALGQLKRVDEPTESGGLGAVDIPNQYTIYSYDLLNNLISVNQGVQTRTFAYDALSRLKSATNPESGTINYTYDNNGNLATKIDARIITITYTYDALNRVVQRSYSGESGYTTPPCQLFLRQPDECEGKIDQGRVQRLDNRIHGL